ncbi:MAG TPA: antibiotic biosynthesis monooxygenase family protein [Ktedonosporobacter sp.]|nr:antibiotic biosynthesis monooxygenase family protein [Ktedonosporobacter sp.]
MSSVILINSFEVPEGKEQEFRDGWQKAAEHLRHAPGFLATRLHQSLGPQARFRFVNVAEWESAQHFQAAMSSEAFQQLRGHMPWNSYASLYEVVIEEVKA